MTDFSYMGIADSISIHAPRTGSDGGCRRGGGSHHISIHAPRTGSDVSRGLSGVLHRQFQSTLPARGATSIVDGDYVAQDISIHAPRTGSDARALALLPCLREISIHAPRTGSDNHNSRSSYACHISIHAPRTGSDMSFGVGWLSVRISIHAPRTGSDCSAIITEH